MQIRRLSITGITYLRGQHATSTHETHPVPTPAVKRQSRLRLLVALIAPVAMWLRGCWAVLLSDYASCLTDCLLTDCLPTACLPTDCLPTGCLPPDCLPNDCLSPDWLPT